MNKESAAYASAFPPSLRCKEAIDTLSKAEFIIHFLKAIMVPESGREPFVLELEGREGLDSLLDKVETARTEIEGM